MSEFVDVVPGPDGEGVEVPATIESLSARVREFQREWDDAERELAAANAECERLRKALERIDYALRVPAAEYVPAISDAFAIIDEALKETT